VNPTELTEMRTARCTTALLGLLLLAGCSSYEDFRRPALRNYFADLVPPTSRPELPEPAEPSRAEQLAEALQLYKASAPPVADEYLVGPGDVLSVAVVVPTRAESGPPIEAPVDEAGDLLLPLIGKVNVAGRTTEQIEGEVASRYADGYYLGPAVTVVVRTYGSKQVFVSGAVGAPGAVKIAANRVPFLEAILLAGGLMEYASADARLTRGPAAGGPAAGEAESAEAEAPPRTIEIDLDELIRDPQVQDGLWVYPGDIVHVEPEEEPPKRFFYVLGYVRVPGAYPLPEDRVIRTTDAIAYARGLGASARSDKTYLLRRTADGPKVHRLNLTKVAAGKQEDVVLLPDDTIIVSTSWGRRTVDGILHAIGLRSLVPVGY
jgi:polysaccharide export outer membrane protein